MHARRRLLFHSRFLFNSAVSKWRLLLLVLAVTLLAGLSLGSVATAGMIVEGGL